MRKIKPTKYTNGKKLRRDWTGRKNYLVQYRMLTFYVKHGMIVDKIKKKSI